VVFCLTTGSAAAAPPKPRGKTKSKVATRARRSGPPRQTSPTAERFREFQQALADRGYYTGPVNGDWGPESVDALKRFQQDQNLTPDGKLGSLTIIALGLGPKRETDISAKAETAQPE
jgi:peptidoglycan hydrolase-like protein with peptidoglycan-binding domain